MTAIGLSFLAAMLVLPSDGDAKAGLTNQQGFFANEKGKGRFEKRGGGGQKLWQACEGDARRLCGSVLKDNNARAQCMGANQAKLSPGCQEARRTMGLR